MRQHLLFLVLLVCIGAPASGIFTLTTFPDSIHHNTQPGYTDAKFMEVTNNGTETAAYSLLTNPTALLASQVAYYPRIPPIFSLCAL